ncbi:hypothetical protein [[Clostridium] polysaccharolyticum]|uniref:Uncharacterized protein n=1 Tax=[Clostridium] polysaccharolyticum TaxID=29364 RepID=A0A1I0D302_9FIRM|nr:hypothetical protein [[Clostridium] polysaccharolyticum]SET26324.1 hypothetical protein SAMN04487772_11288 [[Clostridium] polysaccharolyticum]
MNESYAEAGVRVKPPFQSVFLKVLLIVLLVFLLLLAILSGNQLLVPLVALVAVLAVYVWPRLSYVEYEYIFCDGQFDFDRITGQAKRKNMLRVDMEDVEVIVSPERREEFDNKSISNVKNYSKGMSNAFMMIASTESSQMKVYFNPSEKMIECMYNKAPSKVKK